VYVQLHMHLLDLFACYSLARLSMCYALASVPRGKTVETAGPSDRWSELCDVMHLLSGAAWKVVTFIARDDLVRYAEEISPWGALRRDLFAVGGIDTGQPTGPEERAGLAVVPDEEPGVKWTQLSLAEICNGVRVPGKRSRQNRGTGLAKGSAVQAIKEAERLGILRHRRNTSPSPGYGASSYSISWKRVMELAQESRSKPGVRTTGKFGRAAK
jgi:hypothetical protein